MKAYLGSLLLIVFFVNLQEKYLPTGHYLIEDTGDMDIKVNATERYVKIKSTPVLTIQDFKKAYVGYQDIGGKEIPHILIFLTTEGREKFRQFSGKNIGKSSGTIINGILYDSIKIIVEYDIKSINVFPKLSKEEIESIVKELNREIKKAR